jgi:hypothetical protein
MALILDSGSIFVHIPKTGGSFVAKVLREAGVIRRSIGHIHAPPSAIVNSLTGMRALINVADVARGRLPERLRHPHLRVTRSLRTESEYRGLRYFCFVREPVSWYQSFWTYMQARGSVDWMEQVDLGRGHPCAPLRPLGHPSFDRFLENVLRERPGFLCELFGAYTLSEPSFIGRQEFLTADLLVAGERLGVALDLELISSIPRINVAEARGRALKVSPTLIDEIRRMESSIYERYGY